MTTSEEGVYWSGLKDKNIGVQSGTTADFFLSDEIELEEGSLFNTNTDKVYFDSLDAAVMDIGLNIDYVIIDELPAKKLVEANSNLACLPLYFEGDNEDIKSYDEYAIAVTKGEEELLAVINEVLTELLIKDSEGVNGIEKLVNQHLGVSDVNKDYNLLEAMYQIISTPKYLEYLFSGFLNTLLITLLAAIIGLFIGFVVAVVKIFAAENKYLKIPAIVCNIYTTVVRGTPVALQLFVMVFALLAIPGFKVTAVILTFGINSGAYVSESIRAGILSVDKGQMEAGRALGLSSLTTMVKIILPQAIKNVIPAIGNELIALVKETAIVSMVGSTIGTLTFDLNQATSAINKDLANYLAPAILAALLYLAIVYLITFAIKLIERRFARSDKY
jgi:His/Glu/Gln/Arg/opine family amino acid ABC transporter permease subunit